MLCCAYIAYLVLKNNCVDFTQEMKWKEIQVKLHQA